MRQYRAGVTNFKGPSEFYYCSYRLQSSPSCYCYHLYRFHYSHKYYNSIIHVRCLYTCSVLLDTVQKPPLILEHLAKQTSIHDNYQLSCIQSSKSKRWFTCQLHQSRRLNLISVFMHTAIWFHMPVTSKQVVNFRPHAEIKV